MPVAAASAYREAPMTNLFAASNFTNQPKESSPVVVIESSLEELLGEPLSCHPAPLPLPATIEEAVEHVLLAASETHDRFNALVSRRDRDRLRRYHSSVLAVVQTKPFAGDLSNRERRELRRYLNVLDKVDLRELGCASLSWARLGDQDWLQNLRGLLATHPRAERAIIFERETEYGTILLGGSAGQSLQRQNILFLADLGGDDIYGIESDSSFSGNPQLIVDFSGSDRYETVQGNALATAIGSASLLLDYYGDDQYVGASLTQGAAVMGAALLMDYQGNDHYEAGSLAQGYGMYGIGKLVEHTGDDSYRIGAIGQGLGMASGLGALFDSIGNDEYTAGGAIPTNYGTPGLSDAWAQGVGLGMRELARGGIGRLLDGAGSDRFDAGSFAMGGGYYLGVGQFINAGNGNDSYLGSRYNFGWGAHGGIGFFRETGGDDRYRTRQIVAAGLAWDSSIALFRDDAGDDHYLMGDFSLGASALGSAALFIDGAGSDQYRGVVPARANQEPPNLSLFMDLGTDQNYLDDRMLTSECRYSGNLSITLLAADQNDANFDTCQASED